jgi:hypothetical protein
MLLLAAVLSMLIGISLGLLGGGGSILTVPILVYVLGVEPKRAIATSLLVVGITSAVALLPHARKGNVHFRTGALFGLAGMAGAFVGGRLAAYVPGALLLVGFGALMLMAGTAMVRGRRAQPAPEKDAAPRELPLGKVMLQGAAVGVVAGLVGAGGGFLVVPALVLLGGLPADVAIGTSLLVIAMQSLAGFAGYVRHVPVDYGLAAVVTVAAVAGSFVGARAGRDLSQATLRKAFGVFVLVMAVVVLAKQIAPAVQAAHVARL